MKTLDIRPSPEVQQAMHMSKMIPDPYEGKLYSEHFTLMKAAVEELTVQFAVQQQMLRDVWGIKKYEERRDKAIATLFPPTEEAKEIERLRHENESLKDMLARAQSGQDNVVMEDEQEDDDEDNQDV